MKKITKLIPVLKIVGFLIIFGIVLGTILSVLNYTDTGGGTGFERFYNLPKNSADAIFFGSSHCHCTVDQRILWDKYGIAGVTFSAGSQTLDHTESFVEIALSEQNPKLIAVEVYGILFEDVSPDYVGVYRSLIGRKWTPGYFMRAWDIADSMDASFDQRFELLTKFPLFHGRYSELTKDDFETELPFLMGYRGSYETVSFDKPPVSEWNGVEQIPERFFSIINQIKDYADSKGVEVLFWAAPFVITREQQEKLNAFAEYADSKGWSFIDYNRKTDELGIDFSSEFRDEEHLNNYGAAKVTDSLGQYIKENYTIEDHSGESKYDKWNDNSRYLNNLDFVHNLESDLDFNTYMTLALQLEEGYSVGIITEGNFGVFPKIYGTALQNLGLSEEDFFEGGFFFIESGVLTKHFKGDYDECIPTLNSEIHVDSKYSQYIIDGTAYDIPDDGIGVFVYDNKIGCPVDLRYVDVYYVGNIVSHFEE